MTPEIAPYGSWKSPINSELITSDSVTLDQVQVDSGAVYWIERRPGEQGRCTIVCRESEETIELLPKPFNARSRVHEYGGGAYCVGGDRLFFVNDADQDVYSVRKGETPVRLTSVEQQRFADLCFDAGRDRLLCICEDYSINSSEPSNYLAAIDCSSGEVQTLHQGHDFYASVKISPNSNSLAWICWDHPDMPWDNTALWRAELSPDGTLKNCVQLDGGNNVSIFQPEWSPDNILYYVTDASGWWNIARLENDKPVTVTREHSEFGLPQWVFGQSTFAFLNHEHIICSHITEGVGQLSLVDTITNTLSPVAIGYNSYHAVAASNSIAACIAASEERFAEVIKLSLPGLKPAVLASSFTTDIDPAYISHGQSLSFRTRHNDEAFAIYYAPRNADFTAAADELPPLIVTCHGGPTGASDSSLDLRKQYWTSRGFAMLDVNYSGSTGYGRAYRERLLDKWGIRDVDDVCDAAKALVDKGLADSKRLIIKGSSAGGYTVLAALTFRDTFSCGASYYGISDLESLATDTHKFESRYLDKLIGPYPEQQQEYIKRSPINYVQKLHCPVIFFQGLQDRVVPPSQAESMVAALRQKGVAVSYVTFEHEQHGFRSADTIRRTLDGELYFYSVIVGFNTAEQLPPVEIENINN